MENPTTIQLRMKQHITYGNAEGNENEFWVKFHGISYVILVKFFSFSDDKQLSSNIQLDEQKQ
jgi:hypothetical protein